MNERKLRHPNDIARAIAVGNRIRAARARAGLTQPEMSVLLGMSFSVVAHWETGRSLPKLGTLEKVANILGTSVEWLMTGDEPDALVRAHTTAEKEALRLMRSVPVSQQPAALAMLNALAADTTS